MKKQKVAIVGASGYSGEELVRLLARHPYAELVALTSRQFVGQTLGKVYARFAGTRAGDVEFIDSNAQEIAATEADVAFLALPHGLARDFAGPLLEAGLRVIDLSADFRIKDAAVYAEYYGETHGAPDLLRESVYGMPELYRDQIRTARLVASPGCYPTSVILPLAPLLRRGLLDTASITVVSMSGVSGAGRTVKPEYLFAECNESVRAYGIPKHRHLAEIEQELSSAAGRPVIINFTPHLMPVTRGISTTIYAQPASAAAAEEIGAALADAYRDEPFVRLLGDGQLPDTKNVTLTNFCDIAYRLDPRTGRCILLSAEDNLVKGASGQAIQSLNLMCGWEETAGLL
ncbi:MAG TPA: N-acetyl-gamma-glutamyl-phosphate reductase [Chthoniobacteraceae bacterium]|jgi:N-acetyl-gamma-glutamyl-phosphate reductase|nr:N-acetyl-gamma-glutamyl-phosphate reductase [Chthoniobacteraceae bacterium]